MRRRDFFKRTQQKRYAKSSRHNPYFRKKGSRTSMLVFFALAGSLILVTGFVVFTLRHPFFAIKEINVHGVTSVSQEAFSLAVRSFFAEPVALVYTKQNRFLFDEEEFLSRLNSEFTFRDVQIEQHGLRLDVRLVERTSQLIWRASETMFVVDLDGVVIRRVETDEQEHLKTVLPLFVDRNQVEVSIGDQVMTSQEIESTFRFQEHLKTQNISFTQTEIDRQAGKWIGVRTKDDYYILFDATGDVDAQADRLAVLLREKVKEPKELQYIDLRFGDHVYYK